MRQKFAAIAVVMALGTTSAWSETTLKERKVGDTTLLEVASPQYGLVIDPAHAGRIVSLVPAGTKTELAHAGQGIGSVTRLDLGGGFDLALKPTVRKLPNGMEVVLASGADNRGLLGGVDYTKTFIFHDNRPYIQIKVELTNYGAGALFGWRLYNDIAVSPDLKASVFQEGAKADAVKGVAAWADNNPALAKAWKIWDRAGSGWGGIATGLGYTLLFRTDPGTVNEVVTFADDQYGAYELRFRDALDRGQSVTRSIYLAVVAAGDGRSALETLRAQPGGIDEIEKNLAQEAASRADDTVRLGPEADRLLVVGNPYRYGFYRTHLAAELPQFKDKADFAALDYATMQKTVYGFPVSAKGMAKYRLIIFVDTPYFYLPVSAWILVEGFVRAGGTAVFVGDHAVGYENSAVEKLLPGRFDYTAMTDSVHHKVMNDRTPYAPLEPGITADSLVSGLDWTAPPPVSVHKSVARAGAEVLLKAGRWPVLTRWRVDQGTVYSFPVCLTANQHIPYGTDEPEYTGSDVIPIKAEPPGERTKSIFFWPGYTDLWQGIAARALSDAKAPAVTAKKRQPAPTPPAFTLTVGDWDGLCRVFRRGYRVPFRVDCREATAPITIKLLDPWQKIVWEKQVAGSIKTEDTLPLDGLAYGDYTVVAESAGCRQTEAIHIRPDFLEADAFLVTSHGDANTGGSDDPAEQQRTIRYARECGLNMLKCTDNYRQDLLRWPARSRRARGDLILLAGLQPSHSDGGFIGGWSSPAHLPEEGLEKHVDKTLTKFNHDWGMAPAGIRTYSYDEPGHGGAGAVEALCPKCLETYRQKYGEPPPKDRNDVTYYRYIQIAEDELMRSYERLAKTWHRLDTQGALRPYGVTNEGSGLQEHPLALSRAMGTYGMDLFSFSPGNWKAQAAYEMALAACDGNPHNLMYNVEAGSFYGGTPIAAQRGQGAYSSLARGARIITWYDWEITELKSRLGIMPERFEAVRRASLEALKIGPVLAGMKRPRGKLAMLVPSAVQFVGTGQARGDNDEVLAQAYRIAQVSCGIVDFLYYQHLREGRLNDYPVLLLAGNDWIDIAMLPLIEKWVRAGGTLLVMPRSGLTGADRKPTELYTRLCPLTWGERRDGAALAGTTIKAGMAWKFSPTGGRQLYAWQDGSAAAVQYDLDKGRVAVFGFVPADAFVLETIFADLKLEPSTTRSSDAEASAWLLGTGAARYVVAINSENRAKQVEFTLNLGLSELQAFDMLSGKPLPLVRDAKGRLLLKLEFEPFWGRAVALLPQAPAKLDITAPERTVAGQDAVCHMRLLNAAGAAVAGNVPVHLTVRDAAGSERPEFSGDRVIHDGVLDLTLALGSNDPTGKWRVEARESWTGLSQKQTFRVVAGSAR